MRYLEFKSYAEMGGNLDSADAYTRAEAKARRLIDRVTHNRLVDETPVRECVKYCMYYLISAIVADDNMNDIASGREIAAMSNDGVSVTFASGEAGNGAQAAQSRYMGIIRGWLDGETTASGVHLLYAGVDA